jgi:hypothetical protein
MESANIARTIFRVTDFLSWQRNGQLQLSPAFQRRSAWSQSQKSYLMDTVARGLPMPIVFIREKLDLKSRSSLREMVDGQQRIRTLLSFIDPSCLPDFDPQRDSFTVKAVHNPEIAGKTFDRLSREMQTQILSYEMSTHVLPLDFSDRDVLQVFARMNSTGLKLNQQELRNAEYAGVFKSIAYNLATEQLDRWRAWGIFTEDQIARMKEVEMVSDLLMNMVDGLRGKTQGRIDNYYRSHDEEWVPAEMVSDRFRASMDRIDALVGRDLRKSAWHSEVNFFTLFAAIYDALWGLGSPIDSRRPTHLKSDVGARLLDLGGRMRVGAVPPEVLDAMQRASADFGRRQTRFDYVRNAIQARD